MTAIIRCEQCHGSHVDGWAGCVALSGPTLAADALAPATGHTETPGTREGLTLALMTELLDEANAVLLAIAADLRADLARVTAERDQARNERDSLRMGGGA